MDNESTDELLKQIRDSLIIVAEALRPQYQAAVLERLGQRASDLASLVKSDRRWNALMAMDSSRSQSEIARQSGMDAGDVSRFVKRLRDAGFVRNVDGRPEAVLSAAELDAVRSAHG